MAGPATIITSRGTNPNNPAAWLEITGIANGLIAWNSVAGKSYPSRPVTT